MLVFALVFSLAGCGATTADVVARVNGDDITRAEFDRLYQQVAAQFGGTIPEDQEPEYRRMLLDMMIESLLIRQEAERLGADMSDEAVDAGVTAMMGGTTDTAAFEQRIVEAGLTMEDLRSSIKESISREFLSEYAASQAEATTLPEAYSLLEHILVADEAVAVELRAQIEAGGDFAALATEKSTDPGSAAQGGSLGWAPTRAYVPEFRDAADKLAVGDVSDPVKSDFGWHIIRKVDERAAGSALADAPAELAQQIEASGTDLALEEYVVGLREAAEIEYLDDTLAPTTP
jgi:parvulin-like peptidyl-prolyl isomerase